jgi:uncharacterized protein involved in response to NO
MKTVVAASPVGPLISPSSLGRKREEPRGALGLAFTEKGFRPFFALASAYAVLIVPLWLFVLNGRLATPGGRDPLLWHSHEMLFGYTSAVIAGFLLTAASRWSGVETAVGTQLMALAALWCAGRLAMLSSLPPKLAAAVDIAFLPALAVAVGRSLLLGGSRRNYGIAGLLTVLALANVGAHLDDFGVAGWARWSTFLALDLVVVMMVVIAGRVIPMFTRNALGDSSIASSPALDRAALGLTLASVLCRITLGDGWTTAAVSLLAGVSLFVRAHRWGTFASRRDAMLWILHAGHAFIAVGFILRALAVFVPVLGSAATHSFTAGAVGCLTLGMMSRVTLGHTGRVIVASLRTRVAFFLITGAAVVRVLGPLLGAWYPAALVIAGTLWALAFALYLSEYANYLVRRRVDGAPG